MSERWRDGARELRTRAVSAEAFVSALDRQAMDDLAAALAARIWCPECAHPWLDHCAGPTVDNRIVGCLAGEPFWCECRARSPLGCTHLDPTSTCVCSAESRAPLIRDCERPEGRFGEDACGECGPCRMAGRFNGQELGDTEV